MAINLRRLLTGGAMGGLLTTICFAAGACTSQSTIITVDPSARRQQISGWEVTAGPPDPGLRSSAPRYRQAVYDRAVGDVGVNRVRLEIRSGTESTSRAFQRHASGEITSRELRALRYATVNDNDDPYVINPAGFDFAELDAGIDQAVLPLKRRLEARGERLFVNTCYVAFTEQITTGDYVHDNPEEYAEFVLAAYLHMQAKYGFVPDSWEVILEPDLAPPWRDGKVLGRAMAATAKRLKQHGFQPRFVAPSVTDMSNTLPYLAGIAATPGALEHLSEISYHRYRNADAATARAIAARAKALGVRTGMLEWWFGRATSAVLFEDLTEAQVSAWQGRTLWGLFDPALQSPDGLGLRPDVRENLQVFRYVRAGAWRINATSTNPNFSAVAFVNPGGEQVVVIRAKTAGELEIRNLAAGSYRMSYALRGRSRPPPDPLEVVANGRLRTKLPGPGLLTLYRAP